MNPVERILTQQETVLHNQAVTHERLQILIGLLIFGVVIGLILVVLVVWVLNVKIATRQDITEMKQWLILAKDWTYQAKSHVSDARDTLKDVKNATAAIVHPSKEEKQIAAAVEQIPEKTADKVVEKLDELKRALLPPLLAVLTLTGASFAGGRAGAADELRRVNAAAAVELAAGEPGSR